ncbi:MAG: helix-turn-helix domain-containing protein [Bacteroidales bacterium]|nr:helix-turn-helix domain-containing protein [Clostridium sp.]MCM1203460.1 helix-turn-helix domain-containing protein [Bacteroidales bacterium]
MRMSRLTMYPCFENRDYYLELGEHISFYRRRARLTQLQLAEKIQVGRSYLSRIESSNIVQTFSLELLFNISRALDVPPKCFFEPFPDSNEEKENGV